MDYTEKVNLSEAEEAYFVASEQSLASCSPSDIRSISHYGERPLRCPQKPKTITPAPMIGSHDNCIKRRDYSLPVEEGDALGQLIRNKHTPSFLHARRVVW